MATGTIKCTFCDTGIVVDFERVSAGSLMLKVSDIGPLRTHWESCPGMDPAARPSKVVAVPATGVDPVERGRLAAHISQWLDERGYIAKGGSRACTMCGANGTDCMVALDQAGASCCDACHNGNTHPAPGEVKGVCAEWAAAHAERGQ